MFGTLFGYELRENAKAVVQTLGILQVMCLVAFVAVAVDFPVFSGFSSSFALLVAPMMPLAVLLVLAQAYWKSMHGQMAYFTHLLPVRGRDLFWSKVLVALVYALVAIVLTLVNWGVLALLKAHKAGLSVQEFWHRTAVIWDFPSWIVCFAVVAVVVQLVTIVLEVAGVMSLSARERWQKHGFGAAVVGFVILYLANQVVTFAAMAFFPLKMNINTGELRFGFWVTDLVNALLTDTDPQFVGIGAPVGVVLLAIGVAWWSVRSIERHTSVR